MNSKSQVENLTSGQGHYLAQTYHVVYHLITSIRQTHQTCFEAHILSQSKVVARKRLVIYEDVTRPPTAHSRGQWCAYQLKWLVNTTFCMC